MKIFNYTFFKDNLAVIDGEIVETDPTEYNMSFSLTMKGLELFEDEYETPIVNVLLRDNSFETESIDFIRAVACSTYLKIEDGKVVQNEATLKEFKEDFADIYKSCASDAAFKVQLIAMCIECIEDRSKKATKNGSNKKPKN